jgi:hypothetical protein
VPTDDAWAHFTPGQASVSETVARLLGPHLIANILGAGYGFDFVDDDAINLAQIRNQGLEVNGNRYLIVILPDVERIPPATLEKLAGFAQSGGTLVATRRAPSLAPGLMNTETETHQITELSQHVFEGATAEGRLVRDPDQDLAATLNRLLPPDVRLSPPATDMGFVHRTTGSAEIYFLANTGNQTIATSATFRVQGPDPQWWDPFTGKTFAARVQARSNEGTTLSLNLEPYGSRVLVFARQPASPPAREISVSGVSQSSPVLLDLSTDWKVAFLRANFASDSDLLLADPSTLMKRVWHSTRMDQLRSWADDDTTRFFSGLALYQKTFTVPSNMIKSAPGVWLDLGEGTAVRPVRMPSEGMQTWFEGPVREAAVVYVNDQRAGSVWHPPYAVNVTGLLRTGENQLRIVVANTSINEMAGVALPDYRLLNSRYGERFTPQDMDHLQPLPSGLLGSIHLVARPVEP